MGLLGETKPVKKPILGVSLYPEQESMEEIENYLTMASRYGFTKIFTSMFSVPGTKEEVFDYFKNFCDLAHKHGMKVSGDCNTAFFKKMGASESDISIFKEMGIDIIRMDLPYFDQRDDFNQQPLQHHNRIIKLYDSSCSYGIRKWGKSKELLNLPQFLSRTLYSI